MRFFDNLLMRFDGVSIKKEFNEKIKILSFIHNEALQIIKPINNIYWCYYLNVGNYLALSPSELKIELTKYLTYVSQIVALHEDLNNYYNSHKIVLKNHVKEYTKVNKLYRDMCQTIVQIIKNHKEMNSVNRTEQNDIIIEKLKEAKAILKQFNIDVKHDSNIVAGS